jgi:lipid A 3-O-deacylase
MNTVLSFRAALLAATVTLVLVPKAHADGTSSGGIWTLQGENASISTTSPSDRYYVNGIHLGWTSPEGAVPGFIANAGHALLGEGTQRVSLGLTQQLYTPDNTDAINPPTDDEPYAGYLVLNLGFIQDTENTRTMLGANLGVIGRDAGGEIVQNDFHSIIGQKGTHGWAYQLPSEPAVDFLGARIWRIPLGHVGGLETDMLPQISGMAGLTAVYLQPAIGFRIGSGLASDYGPPLLAPSPNGGDAYTTVQPVAWYLFASAASKFVAHDEVLEGSDFQDSRGVEATRVVGTFNVGFAVIWRGLRFSYTQVFQTSRFHNQKGDIHEFGSFAVSGTF